MEFRSLLPPTLRRPGTAKAPIIVPPPEPVQQLPERLLTSAPVEAGAEPRAVRQRAFGIPGTLPMLSQAIHAMLLRLDDFLPLPANPPSTVSLVSAEERPIGIGRSAGTIVQNALPVTLRGLRVAATVRFQFWAAQVADVESALGNAIDQLLSQKDALVADGFLDLKLKSVSISEIVPSATAWRQVAEFDILYEFQYQHSDDAGGLIASVPIELRQSFGSALVTGDLVIWNSDAAPALRLEGRRDLVGLSTLGFLPGVLAAGTVSLTRSFIGAAGPPTGFANLTDFLAATTGSSPTHRHTRVIFASITDFLNAFDPPGDSIEFVDELGAPRAFTTRSKLFDPAIQMPLRNDSFEVAFSGATLGANQILYLRGIRGSNIST